MTVIREIRPEEIPVLEDFLYEAIFIPEGFPMPPRSVIENEDLQVYVRDFGKEPDDRCMLEKLKADGYKAVSLSVQKANYALQLYRNVGFIPISDHGDELLMVHRLSI